MAQNKGVSTMYKTGWLEDLIKVPITSYWLILKYICHHAMFLYFKNYKSWARQTKQLTNFNTILNENMIQVLNTQLTNTDG